MMYFLCALHLLAAGVAIISAVVAALRGDWGNLAFFGIMAGINSIFTVSLYPGGRS